ncbi:hypothetical protein [Desulforamulus aquiferis]|uniref:Uncharacterized protein n=1 Tax=Desulforamulus aquiferis TaxID=1397668 RepID=A0AAW7ZBU7_9FIRM|nr:hypothetical protein [Desulforamulus aquiferis]MDO7786802.1 hypothetical protein [Desulforamulus aquiferis]RYD06133.1 hypothetical protein N752_06280 [Desulforamulus aquiferis]
MSEKNEKLGLLGDDHKSKTKFMYEMGELGFRSARNNQNDTNPTKTSTPSVQ